MKRKLMKNLETQLYGFLLSSANAAEIKGKSKSSEVEGTSADYWISTNGQSD